MWPNTTRRRVADVTEQLVLIAGRLGQERFHVGHRRSVAIQSVADPQPLRELTETVGPLDSQGPTAGFHGLLQARVATHLLGKRGPAIDVAADPTGGGQLAQSVDRLVRPRAEQGIVATEQKAVGSFAPGVLEHGLEGGKVPVYVVDQRQGRHARSNSIAAMQVRGPAVTLRYATLADAPALMALGSDPAVTRFFSWGPYTDIEQPRPTSPAWPRSAIAVSGSIS